MSKFFVVLAAIGACTIGLQARPVAVEERHPGVSTVCGEFLVLIPIGPFPILFSRPDEGWAYVDTSQKRREATGIAFDVQVADTDTPANHYSHDLDFKILLDPGQDDLLSKANGDGLPVEWETGIRPPEKTGDGANPIFPKWAWPGQNDRVWVEGNWIHDCGHPQKDTGLYSAEIHPARAVASMRERTAVLPGTGTTPVPVTLTDLYISGNGGFAPNQLNCGPQIILGGDGDTCGQDPPPASDSYKTTPINDTDFSFNVCLPPRPTTNAIFSKLVTDGPDNTVSIAPLVQEVPAGAHCVGDPGYDQGKMLLVTVPLKNTATPPMAVYSRRIYAGWVVPPDPVLPHRKVTLNLTNLKEDHDLDPGDGELTFWWMNFNLATHGWLRLSDFANGNMNDYDDESGPGAGEMTFTNASRDFYMRHGQSLTVESQGFEQDCFDNAFGGFPDGYWFTQRSLSLLMYATCYSNFTDAGAGDRLARTRVSFTADDLGTHTINENSEYDFVLKLEEVPLTFEDTSDLSVQTACKSAGEVALVGQPLTCTTQVDNRGFGLPRQVKVSSRFSGSPLATINSATWSIGAPLGDGTKSSCPVSSEALCSPDTIPLGSPLAINTTATPSAPGLLTERAEASTASSDPDLMDNVASATIEVFRSVSVDVSPENETNEVNLNRRSVTVAIMTTADFDAATVDPLSVCFGDGGTPAERSCTEEHGDGHLQDVNKDKLPDLILHFDVAATGIDPGDGNACLLARTRDGVGLYGCDTIIVK
jgi:hypothetical protein